MILLFPSATVVYNARKPRARALYFQVVKFLREQGVEISPAHGKLLVTIGGDGTILFHKKHYDKPIFGIGTATSFLCIANVQDWKPKLAQALRHAHVRERSLLSSSLNGRRLPDGLNDVFVRSRAHRIVVLGVHVNRARYKFRADGLIVATPTGSGAYAYSCGAEELSPDAKKIVLAAIAPFRRLFHPLVVNDDQHVLVKIETECPVDVVVDGQACYPVGRAATLRVWKSKKTAKFVTL